jgi:hypothetical protein
VTLLVQKQATILNEFDLAYLLAEGKQHGLLVTRNNNNNNNNNNTRTRTHH